MLRVLIRRSTSLAQKVSHWAGPPQGCWISSLAGSRAPSARPPPAAGPGASAAVFGFVRSEPLPRNPPYAATATFLARNQNFHSSVARPKKRPRPEPPPRELGPLHYEMKDLWKGPKPALYLGFAGLIPFVSPPLLMAMAECYVPELGYAQLAYSASIVSFLGGARWGFALPASSPARPDWINLANSVVPSLLAWLTMLMSDSMATAATMAIMSLGISLHYDLFLLPTYPGWLKALRAVLTAVAFLSILGTLVVQGTYPEKKIFSD